MMLLSTDCQRVMQAGALRRRRRTSTRSSSGISLFACKERESTDGQGGASGSASRRRVRRPGRRAQKREQLRYHNIDQEKHTRSTVRVRRPDSEKGNQRVARGGERSKVFFLTADPALPAAAPCVFLLSRTRWRVCRPSRSTLRPRHSQSESAPRRRSGRRFPWHQLYRPARAAAPPPPPRLPALGQPLPIMAAHAQGRQRRPNRRHVLRRRRRARRASRIARRSALRAASSPQRRPVPAKRRRRPSRACRRPPPRRRRRPRRPRQRARQHRASRQPRPTPWRRRPSGAPRLRAVPRPRPRRRRRRRRDPQPVGRRPPAAAMARRPLPQPPLPTKARPALTSRCALRVNGSAPSLSFLS